MTTDVSEKAPFEFSSVVLIICTNLFQVNSADQPVAIQDTGENWPQ